VHHRIARRAGQEPISFFQRRGHERSLLSILVLRFLNTNVPAGWGGWGQGKVALEEVFSGITLKSFMIQFLPR
jgi:hypothetical protein